MPTILIIDDEEKLRRLLSRIISLEGYPVLQAGSLSSARAILATDKVDIILCDVKLPDGNGVDFTKEITERHPAIALILLTAYGNIPDGVQATKNGAFDYIVKGDDNDKIIPLLSQAAEKVSSGSMARRSPEGDEKGFGNIVGESEKIKAALLLAKRVAPLNTSVLLTGETGTGKEVFARAIHQESARKDQPFVAINCSAFSKELLDSELFGYKAGAFTGALRDRKGLIEEAAGGTLFLDEIGEMAPELQPKLLRLLEDGSYYAVGDAKQRKADVRIIAATNRPIHSGHDSATFRSDLYYRLAVFTIELPPLRERLKDIPALAESFTAQAARQMGKKISGISKEALTAIQHCPWKGNIRELKHALERAVILEDSGILTLDSLPLEAQHQEAGINGLDLASVERAHILKVLQATGGNKAEAARILNIGIATLYRKVEEYGFKEQAGK